ncbi:MAG: hypothetical protein RLZZ387_4770 [Chloroflexota bacterium]|jgi:UV DNA damage endonuclease
MLDAMALGPEAVLVTHGSGVYGDIEAGRERWARIWKRLAEKIRRRLVLENDDTRYGVSDTLWIHQRTGVPLVFDYLQNRQTGKVEPVQAVPVWTGHSDYISPFEFIGFMRGAASLPDFDVMLGSKRKDVALLRCTRTRAAAPRRRLALRLVATLAYSLHPYIISGG